MDIKWFEDLLVLLEEKSFTRAAARRHVTQPAFSRRIRLLEEWLGVPVIDRTTKPIRVLPLGVTLEEGLRDLVNRLYSMRSNLQASALNQDRVIFVVQHTLAVSIFPNLIRHIKEVVPNTAYRLIPENNDDCEASFLKDGQFLLGYEALNQNFDQIPQAIERLNIGTDSLIPVISQGFLNRFSDIGEMLETNLPLLMYQQDGFLANILLNSVLPGVLRDYRTEVICESAFSASLKEMVLADMGIAWVAGAIVQSELERKQVISLEQYFGSTQLNVILLFKKSGSSEKAKQIFKCLEKSFNNNISSG